MNAISKWTLALLTLLLGTAHAQSNCTTLVYFGAPITVTSSVAPPPLTMVPMAGVITLQEQQLSPGLVNQVLYPSAFDFSATWGPLVTNNSPQANPYIGTSATFTTDSTGKITAWNVSISWSSGNGQPQIFTATTTQNGDTLTFTWTGDGPQTLTGTSTTPGTWTCLADLIAQAAASQAQDTTLTAQVAALTAQRNSYLNGYLEANATIAELNAQVGPLTQQRNSYLNGYLQAVATINELNAAITVCRTHQGKC